MDYFSAYGALARRLRSPVLIAGRYRFQVRRRRSIVADVRRKLALRADHRLLDVGCGVGWLLTPLSRFVREAVGVDHRALVRRYRSLGVPKNVRLVAGAWPRVSVPGLFDRLLVYSVLHYLPSAAAANRFVEACVAKLAPGGRLLLGDIPNTDAAARSARSAEGRRLAAVYERQRRQEASADVQTRVLIFGQVRDKGSYLNDAFLLAMMARLRRRGLESYLLSQPSSLPFSGSREDIVVWRRS